MHFDEDYDRDLPLNEDVDFNDDAPDYVVPCPACGADVHEDTQQCPVCGDWIVPGAKGSPRTIWVVAAMLALAGMTYWIVR